MLPRDLTEQYRLLGLRNNATDDEVRAAYRRLAKKFHPDANDGDLAAEEIFKKVAAAYQAITSTGRNPANKASKATSRSEAPPPDTAFKRDVHIRLNISLEEAATGILREIKFPRKTYCRECNGTGMVGPVRLCPMCKSERWLKQPSSETIKVPPGARPGHRVLLQGLGNKASFQDRPGDLIVEVQYKPHPYLLVDGNDLRYRAMISLVEFIEGGRIRIPSPSGPLELDLPAQTPSGRVLRLPNCGLPAFETSPAGDLLVSIELCVPRRLSSKEKQRIEALQELPGFHIPFDERGFVPKGE